MKASDKSLIYSTVLCGNAVLKFSITMDVLIILLKPVSDINHFYLRKKIGDREIQLFNHVLKLLFFFLRSNFFYHGKLSLNNKIIKKFVQVLTCIYNASAIQH